MKVRAVEAAKQEIAGAIAYHRGISSILGDRFERALNRAILEMIDYPTMHPYVSDKHRRRRMKKFKYGIVYEIISDEIVIIAFMHQSRQPDYWKDRA